MWITIRFLYSKCSLSSILHCQIKPVLNTNVYSEIFQFLPCSVSASTHQSIVSTQYYNFNMFSFTIFIYVVTTVNYLHPNMSLLHWSCLTPFLLYGKCTIIYLNVLFSWTVTKVLVICVWKRMSCYLNFFFFLSAPNMSHRRTQVGSSCTVVLSHSTL